MKPKITLITIGVDDLERSLRFYRDGLGLVTDGIVGQEFEYGSVVFFDMKSGLRLALWPRASIAHDSGLSQGPRSATEFVLAHNVSSASEVDAVMKEAEKSRCPHREGRPADVLWRIRRILSGSGRPHVGGCVESAVGGRGLIDAQPQFLQR